MQSRHTSWKMACMAITGLLGACDMELDEDIVSTEQAWIFSSPSLWVANFGYEAGGWRVAQHPRTMADVNGDGLMDVVGFGNAGVWVSLSTGDDFTLPALWVDNYGHGTGWRSERHPRLLADVNGDGMEDVVGFGNAGVYVSLSAGTSFTTPRRWVNNFGYHAGGWRVEQHPRMLADVNGDGMNDVVGFGNAGVWVSLSTGSAFTAPALWVGNFGYEAGGWRVAQHPRMMAEVNGDGLADVVGFGNAGVWVSVSTGSGFTPPALWVSGFGYEAGGWRVEQHPRMMADVNGDGRDDVVGFGNEGVWVAFSTGLGFTVPEIRIENYGYSAGGWRVEFHPRMMADVNGDGRQDVVGFGNGGVWVSLSLGLAFTAPQLWVNNFGYEAGGWRVEQHPRMMADVNGDGRDDVVGFGNAGVWVSVSMDL